MGLMQFPILHSGQHNNKYVLLRREQARKLSVQR